MGGDGGEDVDEVDGEHEGASSSCSSSPALSASSC